MIAEQIHEYLASLSSSKRAEMEVLHQRIIKAFPDCKLWFLNGKDDTGKIVANPNIGYGQMNIHYTDGRMKPFYQVGISANTKGISVYIIGNENKKHLTEAYGKTIGKATITGYCIKFKSLQSIDMAVLETAIRDGFARTS